MITVSVSLLLTAAGVAQIAEPAAATEAARSGPGPLGAANIPITFKSQAGWIYDGRIEIPAEGRRRPWAVMLLHLGSALSDIKT